MMLSVLKNPVTLAKSGNSVGKTHAAASIAIWFYKCFPGSQVYTAAAPPEKNLKTLLWGEINSIVLEQIDIFERDRLSVMHIERGPKSFITGVTIPTVGSDQVKEAKFAGKHAPFLLFIIDESDAVPAEVFQGIESCMSGGFSRLLALYNPRDATGPIYRKEKENTGTIVELSAFNHPNVLTGEDIIPGAVTRDVTVRRISQWARPLAENEEPGKDSFELPECLIGAQTLDQKGHMLEPLVKGIYIVEEPALNYMVLGKYPSASSHQLIREEWVDAAFERYRFYIAKYGDSPPKDVKCSLGFDVAEFGEDENIIAVRYGNMIKDLIFWKGIDTIKSGERGIEIYKSRNAKICNVDATGIGAGIAPHMKTKGCNAVAIKVASSPTKASEQGEFEMLRDQMWWAYREWLKTCDTAMIRPDKKLKEDSLVPRYEFTRNGKIKIWDKDKIKKELRRSPDRADGVCLLFAPERTLPGFASRSV